jgi:tetratricopeptide (TPR) repeat protein
MDAATRYKDKGNKLFKSNKYKEAIASYTASIDAHPTCLAYANRALARLTLKQYTLAMPDCTSALSIDPTYVKALLRRGTAHKELRNYHQAALDFDLAVRLEPENVGAAEERMRCLQHINIGDDDVWEVLNVNNTSSKVEIEQEHTKEKKYDTQTAPLSSPLPLPPPPPSPSSSPAPTTTTAKLPLKPPNTGIEFETKWRSFSRHGGFDTTNQHISYLSLIEPPQRLGALLKQTLSPPLLYDIIKALLSGILVVDSDIKRQVQQLSVLTEVPRFGLNMMSLPSGQKKELMEMWGKVERCVESRGDGLEEEIRALKLKYM